MFWAPPTQTPCLALGNEFWGLDKHSEAWIGILDLGLVIWTLDKWSGAGAGIYSLGSAIQGLD